MKIVKSRTFFTNTEESKCNFQNELLKTKREGSFYKTEELDKNVIQLFYYENMPKMSR